ncbi:MAG: type II toxin-antitoxin system HigB family toxin [Bacteroidetes bacterium]|nr:type II toxin-antitoxin system HigB family toxin [Bacteroidota bacterium]
MKVHLVKKQSIRDFASSRVGAAKPLGLWLTAIKYADWNAPADIRATFGSADLLGQGTSRVVFNIGGNKFRLIATYYFGEANVHLFVKWIGTHSEYERLCYQEKQYTVGKY